MAAVVSKEIVELRTARVSFTVTTSDLAGQNLAMIITSSLFSYDTKVKARCSWSDDKSFCGFPPFLFLQSLSFARNIAFGPRPPIDLRISDLDKNGTHMGSHYRVRTFSTYITCPSNYSLGVAREESAKHSRLSTREKVRIIRSVLPCKSWKLASEPTEARKDIKF